MNGIAADLVWDVVFATLAVLLGSLFAGGDAALTAIPEARLHAIMSEDGHLSRAFRRYAKDPVRVTSRWLVARVACIGFAAALGHGGAQRLGLTNFRVVFAVLGVVLSYGMFAETACLLARRRPELIGAVALRVLWPFELLAIPVAWPLTLIGHTIAKGIPQGERVADTAEHEVAWAVREGEKSGEIATEQGAMIRKVLDFKELQARDVMVPRSRTHGIDVGLSIDAVFELAAREGHSRYPVYRDNLDHVVGLLYAKDLFAIVRDGKVATTSLATIMRTAILYVAETQSASQILREMQARRMHLAVVVDEFGGTAGIITLEDIIEEIVGDIRDEHDTENPWKPLGEGHLLVDAALPLSDVAGQLGMELPDDGDGAFESLGGLVIHRIGRVPTVGATVDVDGLRLIVREADERRVLKVEIVDLRQHVASENESP